MIAHMTPRAERPALRDYVIAALISAFGVLVMNDQVQGMEIDGQAIDTSWLTIPLFLAVTVPVLWRRIAPLQALAASFAGLLVHILAFGEVSRCGPVFMAAAVLAFSIGSLLERREALLGLGLALAMCVVMTLTDFATPVSQLWGMYGWLTAGVGIVWGIGRVAHSRRAMAAELEVRTGELRAARDERARLEVATDRARLGGELDELLQRRLGKLAALADGGAPGGDAAVVQLEQLERESREALEQMRELVGVLRSDDGGVALAPVPTLAHLEALVMRSKGERAHVTLAGDPRVLPAGVELSAYRVVEYLLDGLDDAPGVDVEVRFLDDALELKVAGPARRRAETGAAVERARERIQLHRGTLTTSTRHGRAEATARLPIGATA